MIFKNSFTDYMYINKLTRDFAKHDLNIVQYIEKIRDNIFIYVRNISIEITQSNNFLHATRYGGSQSNKIFSPINLSPKVAFRVLRTFR